MTKNIIFLILFFASFLMKAQEPVSVHLSEKDGLPGNEFYGVLEDEKGFIWLSSEKGLYRYDGKVFKDYSNVEKRGLSVFNLEQDAVKRIWCNNISGQFFYIENDKLNLFIDFSKVLKGELANFKVNDKYLWIFTQKKIYKVNLKTKKIDFNIKSDTSYGVPFKYNNAIYFGSLNSISKIISKNTIKDLFSTKILFKNIQAKSRFFKIGSSLFFMRSKSDVNTFYKFNISKNKLITVKGLEAIAKDKVYSVFENDNEVWVATNSGVWVYEFIRDHFKLKKQFLKDKKITKILKDVNDNYWFTTLNNGIYVIPNIGIETCNISQKNKNITSLDKVNDSTLVFGLANGNVGFYNSKTHTSKIINLPTKDRVSALKYHPNKNIVFISKDLSGYTLNYNSLEHIKFNEFQTIKSFSILENNNLFYTDYIRTVLVIDADLNKTKKYISNNKRTYASFYDKEKKEVYVAFVDGLVNYDSLWNPKKIRYKDKSIYGKSITKTNDGVVWVTTFKEGVFGIKNNKVIHHFTTENGLSSNKIGKAKADQNMLWITLDNSIQILNVNTKKLQTLTKRDGIVSYNISGIEVLKNKIYFSSNEGLFSIDKQKKNKRHNSEVYFNKVEINEVDTLINSSYTLNYDQNAIKIGFNVNEFLYNQNGKYKYRLKGFNNKWLTTDIGVNTVKYNSLPTGKYIFQVQAIVDDKTNIKNIEFTINKPFWETWWFILCGSLFVLGSTVLYFKNKIRIKEKERVTQLEKISLEKEMIAMNLTALRSQMNPHFIFNALNSIQDLILKEDTDSSYDYIVMFAELVRNTLSYSNQDFIPIEKELEFLKVYLQLEKLRFGEAFNYTIDFKEKEYLEVPSLLVQPFIENALIHGLFHKVGKKRLNITFSFVDNTLQCVITDNGVGRKKAAEIAVRQGNHHESFALSAIEKRLEIFKKQYNHRIGYLIEDLYKNETSTGTKVILTMPFKKRF